MNSQSHEYLQFVYGKSGLIASIYNIEGFNQNDYNSIVLKQLNIIKDIWGSYENDLRKILDQITQEQNIEKTQINSIT